MTRPPTSETLPRSLKTHGVQGMRFYDQSRFVFSCFFLFYQKNAVSRISKRHRFRERERVKFDQIRRLLDYVHGRSLKICSNFRMLSDWLVPFERGISLSEECYNLAFTQQYKNKDRSLHRSKGVVIKISVTLIFGQVFAVIQTY